MRIVVASKYPIIAESLSTGAAGHEIVASASTGAGAIEAIRREKPAAVILDLALPDVDGFRVAEAVRDSGHSPLFVALSSRCDAYTVLRIEKSGFRGFLDMRAAVLEELRNAIAALEQGCTCFPPSYKAVLAAHRRDPLAFDKLLSGKQQTMLSMIGSLMNDREIARALGISECAVEKQRFRLMRKLDLSSRLEAVRYARNAGLCDLTFLAS